MGLRADCHPIESKSQLTTEELRGRTLTLGCCVLTKGQEAQENDQKFQLERDQAFSFLVCFCSEGQLLTRNLSQSLNLASGPLGWQLSGRKECRLHLTLSLLAGWQTLMSSSGFSLGSHCGWKALKKAIPSPTGHCLFKALSENNPNQHVCNQLNFTS